MPRIKEADRAEMARVSRWITTLSSAHLNAEQAFAAISRSSEIMTLGQEQTDLLLQLHDDLIDLGRDIWRIAIDSIDRRQGRPPRSQRALTKKPPIIVHARNPRKTRREGASR